MNKVALYIPRPGWTSKVVQCGYVNALRHLGWKVYCGDPKIKLCCHEWITKHNIQLIITHSRYGIRQLPIQAINDNQVAVVINALPLNPTNKTIDEPYEFAHEDEPDLISKIDNTLVHTNLEPDLWPEYMCGWLDLMHLPVAGNIMKALPSTCSVLTDVAMVANFNHRQNIMKCLIQPLFEHIDLLGYSYQVFGDNIWQLAGFNYSGPLVGDFSKLANVYATAKISPNVHTGQQVKLQAFINERSFQILLCGGLQVTDNPLTLKYLGDHCLVATSVTDYIQKVVNAIESQDGRFDRIRAGIEHTANNHTYFNRLKDLFYRMALPKFAKEAETEGKRAAIRHCFEMDARLSAVERGVCYEQKIGTT